MEFIKEKKSERERDKWREVRKGEIWNKCMVCLGRTNEGEQRRNIQRIGKRKPRKRIKIKKERRN